MRKLPRRLFKCTTDNRSLEIARACALALPSSSPVTIRLAAVVVDSAAVDVEADSEEDAVVVTVEVSEAAVVDSEIAADAEAVLEETEEAVVGDAVDQEGVEMPTLRSDQTTGPVIVETLTLDSDRSAMPVMPLSPQEGVVVEVPVL